MAALRSALANRDLARLLGAFATSSVGTWAFMIVLTGISLPAVAVALRARLGGFEAGAQVPEESFRLLRGLELFSMLPVAIVENLAVRAQRGYFYPGERIVEQGHEARGFYVIEAGNVEVFVDGALRRREGPREYFGEIALLRGGPRTATVRAASDVTVLALEREGFLESVGSHARSAHEAETVVVERLGPVQELPQVSAP